MSLDIVMCMLLMFGSFTEQDEELHLQKFSFFDQY